jgi:two-component system nitrate/nitrite sensor histidine kinase NarX
MRKFGLTWLETMKLRTIQGRMGLLFLAFFVLVAISVVGTFWGIETQKNDAMVVNLAGRQRMLVQQMRRLSLEIVTGGDASHLAALGEAAATFDQTLQALRLGGEAPYSPGQSIAVPKTQDPVLLVQLGEVTNTWRDFSSSIEVILATPVKDPEFAAAADKVEALSPDLLSQADAVVQMYEGAASQKIARLRWIQIGFFASALLLLGIGGWMTRRIMLEPLNQLEAAATRIGSGDLASPIHISGQGEIKLLADTFESMRAQLKSSQEKLVAWANTLEERVAQRTSELEALYQVSRDISSRLDTQQVLRSVTDKARELLDGEVALLCLLDENEKVLNLHATSGPREAVIRSSSLVQGGLAGQVLSGERALPCGVEGCLGSCGIVAERFRTSHLAAPLRMGDRVIGALCVGSPQNGAFSEEAERLLTKLANSAAIALENARLYNQAERLAVLEDRQRIAAEMHDGLAQSLSFAQVSVDLACNQIDEGHLDLATNTLRSIEKGLDQAVSEVRRAIASLQEDFPLHFNLQQQLANLVTEFSRENEILVSWEAPVKSPLALPHQAAEQVLRVVREALINARRHAQAEAISVRLEQAGEEVRTVIEDNGVGFDPQARPADDGRQHFGVNIMQARAARLGGRLVIDSSPQKGTRVILAWPKAQAEIAPMDVETL